MKCRSNNGDPMIYNMQNELNNQKFALFTIDMVQTLNTYFHAYECDGIVKLEVTPSGLWLVNPNGGQQFLGSATKLPKNRNVAFQ